VIVPEKAFSFSADSADFALKEFSGPVIIENAPLQIPEELYASWIAYVICLHHFISTPWIVLDMG
jgi:hypothetical protein